MTKQRKIVSLSEVKKPTPDLKPTKDGKALPKPVRKIAWPQGKQITTNKAHAQGVFVAKLKKKKEAGGSLTEEQEKLLASWTPGANSGSNTKRTDGKKSIMDRINFKKTVDLTSKGKRRERSLSFPSGSRGGRGRGRGNRGRGRGNSRRSSFKLKGKKVGTFSSVNKTKNIEITDKLSSSLSSSR